MTKAVATQEKALPPAQFDLPDDFQGLQFDQSDIKLPSCVLWQDKTAIEELADSGIQPGEFCIPVTATKLGESFEAVVVDKKVTVKTVGPLDPKTKRRETTRFSSDGVHWDDTGDKIQPAEFQFPASGDKEGVALRTYHYVIIPKGHEQPVVLSFKGASVKHARSLNYNLMNMTPPWRSWFKFFSAAEDTYFVVQSKPQPKKLVDQATHELCLDLYMANRNKRVVSDEMTPDAEEPYYS